MTFAPSQAPSLRPIDAPLSPHHSCVREISCRFSKSLRSAIQFLRKITENVPPEELQSAEMQKFIDDLIETMKEYDGVGLAADQVHESKQVTVLEVADNPRYPEKPKGKV
jgi:peptide deformylase